MLKIDLTAALENDSNPSRPIREFQQRRPTWRPGTRVVLGDRGWWWLPPIDLALVATCRPFRRDAGIALAVALFLEQTPAEDHAIFVRSAVYHVRMARLGVTLLQQNYDLDEASALRLITFAHLDEMLCYSRSVAEAFAAAATSWYPLQVGGQFVV